MAPGEARWLELATDSENVALVFAPAPAEEPPAEQAEDAGDEAVSGG